MMGLSAQAPSGFTYQAVLRGSNGNILENKTVNIIFSIFQGTPSGTKVYSESHTVKTDGLGIVNLAIGKGTIVTGSFSGINWSTGSYFISISVDGTELGTTQLLSVPFALWAEKAGNGFSGNYNDLTNKPDLANVATSGNYTDLSSKPTLAPVATSGNYTDLNSKPTLAPVATSGNYTDLNSKPSLAPVATTGNYDDLLSKPELSAIATSGIYEDLLNKPQLFDGTWQNLSNKPTTVAGFGISDAATKAYVDSIKLELKLEMFAELGVDDMDGNSYTTVKIGNQIWMAENLKTTKYNDNTPIPNVTGDAEWAALTTPGYCWQENNITNKDVYGAIYNWHSVNTGKLCPSGWHIPSNSEWAVLVNFLGGSASAGGKMKEAGYIHWSDPNTGATNESNFTALPGASRGYPSGGFSQTIGLYGIWWTSSVISSNTAQRWYLSNTSASIVNDWSYKADGLSVRCIKDDKLSLPVIVTTSATDVLQTTAVSGGSITADGGSAVISRGICWSTTISPTISNNKTSDGTGTGTFISKLYGLTPGTTYYIRAFATNGNGTSYGNEISLTPDPSTVSDGDGNLYTTVTIGTQVWMKENVRTTRYNDGTSIPNVTDDTEWNSLSTPAYCWYNNDITSGALYGGLYNWFALNTNKLCPVGWHVGTDSEWHTLILQYDAGATLPINGWESSSAGAKLKEAGTVHWVSPNLADNSSGMTILPSGVRHIDMLFNMIYYGTRIWAATESNSTNAYNRGFWHDNTVISRNVNPKTNGFSVRCIKN